MDVHHPRSIKMLPFAYWEAVLQGQPMFTVVKAPHYEALSKAWRRIRRQIQAHGQPLTPQHIRGLELRVRAHTLHLVQDHLDATSHEAILLCRRGVTTARAWRLVGQL